MVPGGGRFSDKRSRKRWQGQELDVLVAEKKENVQQKRLSKSGQSEGD